MRLVKILNQIGYLCYDYTVPQISKQLNLLKFLMDSNQVINFTIL